MRDGCEVKSSRGPGFALGSEIRFYFYLLILWLPIHWNPLGIHIHQDIHTDRLDLLNRDDHPSELPPGSSRRYSSDDRPHLDCFPSATFLSLRRSDFSSLCSQLRRISAVLVR
jgi:hypothetical protein